MESSPRFRSTNSENSNSTYNPCNNFNGKTKLRLMCSNGGHIVPRPHDKSLCYVGGETRMVAVDRHVTLLDLTRRLSKTLFRSSSLSNSTSPPPPPPASASASASSFTLKYQLPSEDLDSLISVTTDEDLENMIDEYERINERLNSSSRIRLFVFPTNPESVSSIGSFLENPVKSEDWFLNALNGTNSGFSDTSSVNNCLLDLDDEICDKKDVTHKTDSFQSIGTTNLITGNNSGQDIHSIPDSPWMETTTSSFGSASSTPSIGNLAPIKMNGEDYSKNIVGGGGIEEEVFQIGVEKRRRKDQDGGGLMASPAPVVVSGSPTAILEQSDPFLSYQERSEQGLQMNYVKHHHDHQQQNLSTGFDSILSELSITDPSSPVTQIKSSSYNNRTHDPNFPHDQITRTHNNSAYLSPMPTTQVDSPRHQLHYQQPQFIPPLQYIHHHSPPVPATGTPYYHHHHPPMDQQNFMYYIPATHPPQGYNFPFQQPQPSHADTTTLAAATPINQTAMKTEFSAYRTTSSGAGAPQLVRVQSGFQNQQPQHVYYATQAMPRLSAPQYQNMMLVSPVETNLQEQQVRSAQPRQDR